MVIKKCDVCKTEVDTLYDREITTHIDVINGNNVYKKEKLHICRTCMGSINNEVSAAELSWYEDNVKDDTTPTDDTEGDVTVPSNDEPNENIEQNSGHTEGPVSGE